MLEILVLWLICGLVFSFIVGSILGLFRSISAGQVALLSWVIGNGILIGVTLWVLNQDPVPVQRLQDWREELVRRVMPERAVLLADLTPQGLRAQSFRQIDADSDGAPEWLALYAFDLLNRQNPLKGWIYDGDVGTPGVIYPYPLHTPDGDYLGERELQVQVANVVGSDPGELIFWDSQTLSIFKVNPRPADPQGMVCDHQSPPRYENIGFFRGDRVQRSGSLVTVWVRDVMERSQLAIRRIYAPVVGQERYFFPGTHTLPEPVEQSVGFLHERPADIWDTPYAEKIVVGFYVDAPADVAADYLVAGLRPSYLDNSWNDFGSPWPRGEVDRFLLRELRYEPPPADAQTAKVTVTVVPVRTGDSGPAYEAQVELTWVLVREEGRWKMQQVDR
ncbi:MAG: hypothetical protein GX605_09415 [Chloroflexi bacterium]|nr:hypothetical protein [Chloroflexota bacterium]